VDIINTPNMQEVWIQAIAAAVSIIGTVFACIKYIASQTAKREQSLLEHTEKTQSMMLEYFETKNGHMERMADKFTATSKELAASINNLSTKIEVMSSKKK
jgi:flagellar biosynthesis/type III secretory pathway M-ring protein FliF/YscJ